MQHAFTIINGRTMCNDLYTRKDLPGDLLAVRCPVSDVLLLLFHAVLHRDATRCSRATGARTSCGAHPGTAVRDEVMRPRVRASSVLGRVPAGAKLFLGGGAVLWRKTPPPAAARHCERFGQATVSTSAYSDPLKHFLVTTVLKPALKSLCY